MPVSTIVTDARGCDRSVSVCTVETRMLKITAGYDVCSRHPYVASFVTSIRMTSTDVYRV